ncbi:MAG TPA: GNAT family N-acetyltransferase [Chitinophagaceae bacterium]|nr:GNAT family N-acetyltransferase [Chitinophagaceae bacterium]
MNNIIIKEITSDSNEKYRAFFTEGLINDETSFRISPADERNASFPTADRPDNFTLGAYAKNNLAGVVSFMREGANREKLRHKGLLFRMYVSPAYRRLHIGRHLVSEVIQRAKVLSGMEQINLTVIAANEPAKNLYTQIGFTVFSVEKNAIKYKGQYFDEEQMVLFLQGKNQAK